MKELPPEDAWINPSHKIGMRRMEEARSDPNAVAIFDVCCQIMATCPLRYVSADYPTLFRLLDDLEGICRGKQYKIDGPPEPHDARLQFEHHTVGSSIAGGKGGGRVEDGIWLHVELTELGVASMASEVILGQRDRIELIESCDRDLATFDEAIQHGNGVVHCHSVTRNRVLFSSSTDTIFVNESTLHSIARALDRALGLPKPSKGTIWEWGNPTFKYATMRRIKKPGEDTSAHPVITVMTCPQSSTIHKQLIAALRGEIAPDHAFRW